MAIKEYPNGDGSVTLRDTKKNELAGSKGPGATKIPTPSAADRKSSLAMPEAPSSDPLTQAINRWNNTRIPVGIPGWATESTFRSLDISQATDWTDDYILQKETEEDRLPMAGSSVSTDCARDRIRGVIRAEKIEGSEWKDSDNQINSYYRLCGVDSDVDGSIPVFHYSHDPRKVVQRTRLGMLSPDGVFKDRSVSHGSVCSLALTESEVYDCVGADYDDMVFSYENTPSGEPAGMGFEASTDWYDLD